jgi:hypothetical protein
MATGLNKNQLKRRESLDKAEDFLFFEKGILPLRISWEIIKETILNLAGSLFNTQVDNIAYVHEDAIDAEAEVGNSFKPFSNISLALAQLQGSGAIYLLSDSSIPTTLPNNDLFTIQGNGFTITGDIVYTASPTNNKLAIHDAILSGNIEGKGDGDLILYNCTATTITTAGDAVRVYAYNTTFTGAVVDIVHAQNCTFESTSITRSINFDFGATAAITCNFFNCRFNNTLSLNFQAGGILNDCIFDTGANIPILVHKRASGGLQATGSWQMYNSILYSSNAYGMQETGIHSNDTKMRLINVGYTTTDLIDFTVNQVIFQADVKKVTNGVTNFIDAIQVDGTARYTSAPALANSLDFATVASTTAEAIAQIGNLAVPLAGTTAPITGILEASVQPDTLPSYDDFSFITKGIMDANGKPYTLEDGTYNAGAVAADDPHIRQTGTLVGGTSLISAIQSINTAYNDPGFSFTTATVNVFRIKTVAAHGLSIGESFEIASFPAVVGFEGTWVVDHVFNTTTVQATQQAVASGLSSAYYTSVYSGSASTIIPAQEVTGPIRFTSGESVEVSSPNGNWWRLDIDNAGVVSGTAL